MPIYEYRRPDGTTFEVLQSFSDPPLSKDPETGVPVERVLHAPAVHFKGKGFYNTDYGTRKRARETAASGESSSSSNGSAESGGGDSAAKKGSSGEHAGATGSKDGAGSGAAKKEPGAKPAAAAA